MSLIKELPIVGVVVIIIIFILFALAVALLFCTYLKYRSVIRHIDLSSVYSENRLVSDTKREFAAVYKVYGENTNTPAIISDVFSSKLGRSLLFERFMNSAVSSFVTLGLFGTFLGLSLSVSSLTQLISLSSTEEWLSILNSVGGGLVSALSGMGVAFYTSLVGVACAIIFTILRTVFNPQAQRERLENILELWLDHTVAPTLETDYAKDDADRLLKLSQELRSYTESVQGALTACTDNMKQTLQQTTESLGRMIEYSKEPLTVFYDTVNTFTGSTRNFEEINYDLRGSTERLDICIRNLSDALKRASKNINGGDKA